MAHERPYGGRFAAVIASGLAAALLAAAYAPGLGGPFFLDDYFHLQPLLGTGVPVAQHWWAPLAGHAGPTGRPVAMLTFLANAAVHGEALWWWKLTNVVIHLLCGLLLAALAARLLAARALVPSPSQRLAGGAVALVWLLHPLHASTVLYTVQRMTELAALFMLAGMLLYLDGRRRYEHGLPGGGRRVAAAFLVCLPLALFSKEIGVLLPLLWLALEATVFAGSRALLRWPMLRLLYAGGAALAALAAALVLPDLLPRMIDAYEARPFTPLERLLTEARVLVVYGLQAFAPLPRLLGFLHDDLALSRGLLEPPSTLLAIVALGAGALAAFALRRRMPVVAFGLLWFLIGHALEGTLLPLELMFEHRNYLPSAGLLLAAAGLLARAPLTAPALGAVSAAMAVTFGAMTWAQAGNWASEERLYGYVLRHHPGSPWGRGLAAEWLSRQGRHDEAHRLLAGLDTSGAALHRTLIECRRGLALDAARLAALERALAGPLDGYAGRVLSTLGRLATAGGCPVEPAAFRGFLDRALTRPFATRRNLFELHLTRAHLRYRDGELDGAVADLETASRIRAGDPMPLLLAAEFLAEGGALDRAAAYYDRARAVAEDSGWDYGPVLAGTAELIRAAGGAGERGDNER